MPKFTFPNTRSEKAVAPHSSPLAWKSHGRRSLVGCSPWGREELDTTEWLHHHFSLSCNGEGNGNPLQCSCLENPRDGGNWWSAIYGVTQSQTRLKRLSSSSNPKSQRCSLVFLYETVSHSVMSDSVTPWTVAPPGSSVHGILQARILGWVAISFSRWSFQTRDRTWVSWIAGTYFTIWVTREA